MSVILTETINELPQKRTLRLLYPTFSHLSSPHAFLWPFNALADAICFCKLLNTNCLYSGTKWQAILKTTEKQRKIIFHFALLQANKLRCHFVCNRGGMPWEAEPEWRDGGMEKRKCKPRACQVFTVQRVRTPCAAMRGRLRRPPETGRIRDEQHQCGIRCSDRADPGGDRAHVFTDDAAARLAADAMGVAAVIFSAGKSRLPEALAA